MMRSAFDRRAVPAFEKVNAIWLGDRSKELVDWVPLLGDLEHFAIPAKPLFAIATILRRLSLSMFASVWSHDFLLACKPCRLQGRSSAVLLPRRPGCKKPSTPSLRTSPLC